MNALKPEPVSGKPVDVFGRLGHGSAGSDAASTASTHRHACACSVGKITEAFDAHAHAMELEANFPRCVPEPVFIDNMTAVLASHGFSPATAINLVSNCRDELCRSFTEYLDKKWDKPSFNIASLAGMVFCGRTGFKAAMAHAPVVDGKERYVFWVGPHIAISGKNEMGKVWRPGREKQSTACGALLAVLGEITSGCVNVQLDPSDIEMSLLKQHTMSYLQYGQQPNLTQLTYAVHECIVDEVNRTAAASVDLENCEYVVISGIQVHCGFSKTFWWPGSVKKYSSSGVEDLYEEYADCVAKGWRSLAKVNPNSDEFFRGEELMTLQNKERACRLAAARGDLTMLADIKDLPLNKVRDHTKRTLLHVAAIHGQVEVVRMLLEKFEEVDADFPLVRDNDHLTAMDYAVMHNKDAVAKLLNEHGLGLEGGFLRDKLVLAVSTYDLPLLSKYMWFAKDMNAAIHSTDKDGRSLVHIVTQMKAHENRSELLELLLSFGADLDEVDFYGNDAISRTALDDPDLKRLLEATQKPSTLPRTPSKDDVSVQSTNSKGNDFATFLRALSDPGN